jgi:hypothetical protein
MGQLSTTYSSSPPSEHANHAPFTPQFTPLAEPVDNPAPPAEVANVELPTPPVNNYYAPTVPTQPPVQTQPTFHEYYQPQESVQHESVGRRTRTNTERSHASQSSSRRPSDGRDGRPLSSPFNPTVPSVPLYDPTPAAAPSPLSPPLVDSAPRPPAAVAAPPMPTMPVSQPLPPQIPQMPSMATNPSANHMRSTPSSSSPLFNPGESPNLISQQMPSVEPFNNAPLQQEPKTIPDRPSSQNKSEPKSGATTKKSGNRSFLSTIVKSAARILPNSVTGEVHLPDDSDKSLVWDNEKKRWIDKNNPEEESAPPPPPPMMGQMPTASVPSALPNGNFHIYDQGSKSWLAFFELTNHNRSRITLHIIVV